MWRPQKVTEVWVGVPSQVMDCTRRSIPSIDFSVPTSNELASMLWYLASFRTHSHTEKKNDQGETEQGGVYEG
jgi:hypothetical protein